MSIDVIDAKAVDRRLKFERGATERALGDQAKGIINNVIVVFGGWGVSDAGQPLDYNKDASGAAQVAKSVSQFASQDGYKNVVFAYQGAQQGGASDQVLATIMSSFHPLGKLIVYGYSAGGLSALQLSHRLGLVFPYYDTGTKGLSKYFPAASKAKSGIVYGYVRVDLLVTVDVAWGPQSGIMSRRVWPSVRRNINFYQKHGSPIWSHGGPTDAVESNVTNISAQYDWTSKYDADPSSAHRKIDEDSLHEVLKEMQAELVA